MVVGGSSRRAAPDCEKNLEKSVGMCRSAPIGSDRRVTGPRSNSCGWLWSRAASGPEPPPSGTRDLAKTRPSPLSQASGRVSRVGYRISRGSQRRVARGTAASHAGIILRACSDSRPQSSRAPVVALTLPCPRRWATAKHPETCVDRIDKAIAASSVPRPKRRPARVDWVCTPNVRTARPSGCITIAVR
jgi:hypothetical protein